MVLTFLFAFFDDKKTFKYTLYSRNKRKDKSRFNAFMTLDPSTKVNKCSLIRWKVCKHPSEHLAHQDESYLASGSPQRCRMGPAGEPTCGKSRALCPRPPGPECLSPAAQWSTHPSRCGSSQPATKHWSEKVDGVKKKKKKCPGDSGRGDAPLFSNRSFNLANQDS